MRHLFVIILSAVPLLISCGRDLASDAEASLNIKVGMDTPLTKVSPGTAAAGIVPVLWQQGDKISLNGSLSNALSASFSGGEDAVFSFAGVSASSPYNLLYPGSAAEDVNFAGSVIPMYATGSDLSGVFTFHHLGTGVCVTLTGDLQVASLSLNAPGGENIAGVFALAKSAGAFNGNLTPSAATSSMTVDLASPVDLSDGNPHSFYLFFAPGTFSEGLVITAEDVSGVCRSWLFASGKTLTKGYVYQLPATSFSSQDLADGAWCTLEDLTEETMTFVL